MKNFFCVLGLLLVVGFAVKLLVVAMSDVEEYNNGLYAQQVPLGE